MIKKEFKKFLDKINNIFIGNEDVHYCQLCGEKFTEKFAYELSEDCTYSHDLDTEEDKEKYPNYLLAEKMRAFKEKIIISTNLSNSSEEIIKKRL